MGAPVQPAPQKQGVDIKKFVKIGRPGYRVTKQRDADNGQQSLLFEVDYPEIAEGIFPRHRFMSAYEQKVEPPDRKWQYLLFAAEPYETIAFKVPSREVDKSEQRFWSHWNKETKEFFLQFSFKLSDPRGGSAVARPPPPAMVPAPPKPVTRKPCNTMVNELLQIRFHLHLVCLHPQCLQDQQLLQCHHLPKTSTWSYCNRFEICSKLLQGTNISWSINKTSRDQGLQWALFIQITR